MIEILLQTASNAIQDGLTNAQASFCFFLAGLCSLWIIFSGIVEDISLRRRLERALEQDIEETIREYEEWKCQPVERTINGRAGTPDL